MSSEDATTLSAVPVLKGDNYRLWARKMMAYLQVKGLYKYMCDSFIAPLDLNVTELTQMNAHDWNTTNDDGMPIAVLPAIQALVDQRQNYLDWLEDKQKAMTILRGILTRWDHFAGTILATAPAAGLTVQHVCIQIWEEWRRRHAGTAHMARGDLQSRIEAPAQWQTATGRGRGGVAGGRGRGRGGFNSNPQQAAPQQQQQQQQQWPGQMPGQSR